jgi:sulfur-oxidizing protein SoxY
MTVLTRRNFATGALGLAVMPMLVRPARTTPETMQAAIREVIGEAQVTKGRIKLGISPLAETGYSVPLDLTVESPMTEADHVRSIFVFSEKNPLPNIVRFHLGPRAGRAQVSTRIRLGDSQKLVAIARMSDGSLWSDEADVVVTLTACVQPEYTP